MEEELKQALLRVVTKGMNIQVSDVIEVQSYNKFIKLHLKSGDKIRINMDRNFY